ncbi:uncharacterized protein BP5553_07772 [Venustampulla echinocandica]|uniref:HAD-like protein n=1 Tax=Venustampulla echinocandica TaxID=2656787 RepID=A0A370THH0_9HELO|nr:uncharacterized protein BP5553_07772 [Venustampulla echinocandica]RDL34644.1 hypothetical protein BP5553_07772 [Venustampulla echinocandica]
MSTPTYPPSRPRPFILDFDGTITTKDTISTIFQLAISRQASLGRDFTKAHESIISNYATDFSHHEKNYRPLKQDRNTLGKEINYYRGLRPVEIKSFDRVSASGIFGGIGDEEWIGLGKKAVRDGDVVVRNGFRKFRERVEGSEAGVWGIISVNFSKGFVQGVVEAGGGNVDGVEILTNTPDERGVLQGPKIERSDLNGQVVATSDDKLAAMKALLQLWGENGSLGKCGLDGIAPVYVGDSGTDIECLTEDGIIGIIIRDDGHGNVDWSGLEFSHVKEFRETDGGGAKKIYWARDYLEILDSPLFK